MNTSRTNLIRTALTIIVAVGLLIDTFVHFDLAAAFKGNKTSVLSEATVFRIDATVAAIVAVAVLVRPRRYTAGLAFLVAAAGTVAVVLYRYVDVGTIGPLPNMYDPFWSPAGKAISAVGEAVAAVAALALYVLLTSQAHDAAPATTDRAPRLRLRQSH